MSECWALHQFHQSEAEIFWGQWKLWVWEQTLQTLIAHRQNDNNNHSIYG